MTDEIIETSYDLRWREPAWVRVGYGLPDAVRGPRQALDYLDTRWPAARGTGFDQARAKCVAALNSRASCDAAREAFVQAALEADMLVF